MSWRHIVAALLFTLTPLLGSGVAQAVEPDPARAMEIYGEAKRLHEEGRVRESLAKLQEAYEAFPSESILISIVNRHIDLDELEEAAELLQHIDARGKLKRQVARLQKKVNKALALPVSVRLTADVVDATVSIDGAEPIPLPARLDLPRGRHRFIFQASGRSDVELVEMLKGSAEVPIAANLPVPTASWRVAIEPSSVQLEEVRLLLDGQAVRLGKSELAKAVTDARDVLPGEHRLTCLRGFEARADAEFTVVSDEEVSLVCAFPDQSSDISPWAWITGGAGLAALATGVALLANYYAEMPQLEKEFRDRGVCNPNTAHTTFSSCVDAGGDWSPQYQIVSNKQEFGWTFVGIGTGLGVVSGLFFADVLE